MRNMYKLDVATVDQKEAFALARRREDERARKDRIFNACQRTIGIDRDALDFQVQEKHDRQYEDRIRSEVMAAEMVRNDQICELLEARARQDAREMNKAVNYYRQQYQQKHMRKEWDLSNPLSKRIEQPPREHDDDPKCSVSGLQKFLGEDLQSEQRRRTQQLQIRHAISKQMEERENKRLLELETKRYEDLREAELNLRLRATEQQKEAAAYNMRKNVQMYNLALMKAHKEREAEELAQEEAAKLVDIRNHIEGPMLTEDPGQAESTFGAHRTRTDRWKGMTPQQKQAVLLEQEQQQAEAQRKRDAEYEEQAFWDQQEELARIRAVKEERAIRRAARNQTIDVKLTNLNLAKEQRDRRDFLNRVVYTNEPTDIYYQQFNTTSR